MPHKVIVEKKSGRRRGRSGRKRSGTRTLKLAPGSSGYGSMAQYNVAANMAYIQTVKDSLRHKPGAYRQFVAILSEVEKPGADLLAIIDRVVLLLDGYPDLIYSFNSFLPRNYEIEMQDHAVVVKVYDMMAGNSPVRGRTRSASPHVTIAPQGHKDYGESVGYITAVKNALVHSPHKYQQFMEMLADYHSHNEDAVMTVRQIVRLLQDFPRLVLGFNAFLPPGYQIRSHKDASYTIQHPGHQGKLVTVRLSLR